MLDFIAGIEISCLFYGHFFFVLSGHPWAKEQKFNMQVVDK